MRTSSFLLCVLSLSLVSGITVSAYNELNRVNLTESVGLDNHTHDDHHDHHRHHGQPDNHTHHKHNDTDTHSDMKLAIIETRKLLETSDDEFNDYDDIDDTDVVVGDDDDSIGSRRLLRKVVAISPLVNRRVHSPPPPPVYRRALHSPPPPPPPVYRRALHSPPPNPSPQVYRRAHSPPPPPPPPSVTLKVKDHKHDVKTPSVSVHVNTPRVAATVVTVSAAAAATATKTLTKEESLLKNWLATSEGLSAVTFCKSLGIENKFDIYNGCLFDMYTTKDKQIAEESAVAAEEFLTKGKANVGKRFCVAAGDPHCTNYDGEFFHIQEPGVYTITRSFNGDFEVQEKMRKNGKNVSGVPSCMIGAVIRYKRTRIEMDVAKKNKIIVNGIETDLPSDTTITIGGIQIRYGKQNIEWRGDKVQTTGLKLTTPEGFGVLVTGGYCGVIETSVPDIYYGKMSGICGNGNGVKDNLDYVTPSGVVVDVKRGTKSWEMSGYGGPTSYLSMWQLTWKPYGTDCLFKTGCETSGVLRTPLVADAPTPLPVEATKATSATKADRPAVVVSPVAAPTVVLPSHESVTEEIKEAHLNAVDHLNKFQEKIVKVIMDTGAEQQKFERENKKSYDDATIILHNDAESIKKNTEEMQVLQKQVQTLNSTIHLHYRKLITDSSYLHKLEIIKPTFLKSLDDVSVQLNGLKTLVVKTIVKDKYKREMVNYLSNIHFNTHNISGYVATAFMAHYNKYKQLLQEDNYGYTEDIKKLNKLVESYRIQAQRVADVTTEYNKVLSIVTKLKATYQTSVSENADLDDLVKRVLQLLKTKNCVVAK